MFCSECGGQVLDHAKFCGECGSALPTNKLDEKITKKPIVTTLGKDDKKLTFASKIGISGLIIFFFLLCSLFMMDKDSSKLSEAELLAIQEAEAAMAIMRSQRLYR